MDNLSLFKSLSKEQQDQLQDAITEKIRSLIGVHGDIAVLVEYISVMLQSDRHRDLIEQELEAFLQEQSRPFVTWLIAQLQGFGVTKKAVTPEKPPHKAASTSGGNGGAAAASARSPPTQERTGGVAAAALAENRKRSTRAASAGASEPAAAPAKKKREPRAGGIAGNLLRRAVKDAQHSVIADKGAEEAAATGRAERAESIKANLVRADKDTPPRMTVARRAARSRSPRGAGGPQEHLIRAMRGARGTGRGGSRRTSSRVVASKGAASPPEEDARDSPNSSYSEPEKEDYSDSGAEDVDVDVADASPVPNTRSGHSLIQESPGIRSRGAAALSAVTAAALSVTREPGSSSARSLEPPRARPRRPEPPQRETMSAVRSGAVAGSSIFESSSFWGPAHQAQPPQEASPPAKLSKSARLASSPGGSPGGAAGSSRWHFEAVGSSAPGATRRSAPVVQLREAPRNGEPPRPQWPGPPPPGPPPLGYHSLVQPSLRPGPPPPGPPPGPRQFSAVGPGAALQAATVAARAPTSAPPRPRNFVPQKWRVVKKEMAVTEREHAESREVRTLREGEIVESVGPPFTLASGVVRLEIAHPSSAAYPNPIGWVSHDETAVGGGRCLEPGPQPLQATMRPPRPAYGGGGGGGGWRPKGGGKGSKPRSASFTNVTWRPGGAA